MIKSKPGNREKFFVVLRCHSRPISKVIVPPKKPALIPSYDEIFASSTIGGGLVSLTTGGNVTGSTPQKSSVNVARDEKFKINFFN